MTPSTRLTSALLGALFLLLTAQEARAQVLWDTWWRNHELEFLWGDEPWSVQVELRDVRAGLKAPPSGPISGSKPVVPPNNGLLGRELFGPGTLSREFTYGKILPRLIDLAENSPDLRMRRQAVRALGRVVEPRYARHISSTLRGRLTDMSIDVRAEAAFALGLAYDPASGRDLVEIATDSPAGRRLIAGERVPDNVRRGALAGLSASQDESLVPQLLALYETLPNAELSLRRTAIMALGFSAATQSPQVAARFHADIVDRGLDPLARKEIPTALGHLEQRDSIPVLLQVLDENPLDPRVQQSCLIGLGDLGKASDTDLVERLLNETVENKDPDSRRYAVLGAARILGRDRTPFANVTIHERFVGTLIQELRSPRHRVDMPHYALAAGIYLRPHAESAPELQEQLLSDVVDNKDPAMRGAYALALGLSAIEGSGDALLGLFRKNKDQLFRAELALAMGFARHDAAVPELRKLFAQRGLHPRLFELAGTALMLLGDQSAGELLLERFIDSRNFEERRGYLAALANFRSEAVAERMLDLLDDEELDVLLRVGICEALGKLATWRSLMLSAEYSVGRNLGPRDRLLDRFLDTPLDERGAVTPPLPLVDEG